jgi:hypothetical protein
MNHCLSLALVLLLTALPLVHARPPEGLAGKDLNQFTSISEGVARAASLTLLEGLPHTMLEADQVREELASKETVRLHGFPFYKRPLVVPAEAIPPLRRLSSAAGSYQSYRGPKMCGGFHPDYCLVWEDGKATYHLLICFGCHEMKLYGPKSELIVDISDDAFRKFKSILTAFHDQRPRPK